MHSLLKFIQQHANFLIFLCLEVVAFLLFFSENPFQQSTVFSAANTVTASVNNTAEQITSYFTLKSTNQALAEQNAQLLTENTLLLSLAEQQAENDTGYFYSHLRWNFLPAKVVDVQTQTMHNYLVLNKGSRDNITLGQGVISHDGVVGVISAVNTHFALVTPVIHPKMNLSCRLQKNGSMGFLHWQGDSPHYAFLTDIARHVSVSEGDTVVTTALTGLFPENIMVGVIDRTTLPDGDTYYTLRVRLSTDFSRLRYVQILNNPLKPLQDSLLRQIP
jgi:rod shape-determining protein MreC